MSIDPAESLEPFVPGRHGRWDAAYAFHLLERAGFGGSPAEVARCLDQGPAAAVEDLLRPPPSPALPDPAWGSDWRSRRAVPYASLTMEERQVRERKRNQYMASVQADWLLRLVQGSNAPLEKLCLFWHSHFATSAEKVNDPLLLLGQLSMFRAKGFGPFEELLLDLCRDPAMIVFLDSASNVKGRPNENFARELMELYGLGEGRGYTEADVREAARAFTGWAIEKHAFAFRSKQHDAGSKTYLGQTGNWGGEDIVRILAAHPGCAEFVACKLFAFYVYPDPSPGFRAELGRTFAELGLDTRKFLDLLLRSRAFYSDRALRALVKGPVQLVAGTYRKLALSPLPPPVSVRLALRRMGQEVLWPPDVNGWKEGTAWINTNAMMMRYHWLHYLATGEVPDALRGEGFPSPEAKDQKIEGFIDTRPFLIPNRERDAEHCVRQAMLCLFGATLPESRVQELVQYLRTGANGARVTFDLGKNTSAERLRGALYLMMCSPEYQMF